MHFSPIFIALSMCLVSLAAPLFNTANFERDIKSDADIFEREFREIHSRDVGYADLDFHQREFMDNLEIEILERRRSLGGYDRETMNMLVSMLPGHHPKCIKLDPKSDACSLEKNHCC